jgi:hypothetical protein
VVVTLALPTVRLVAPRLAVRPEDDEATDSATTLLGTPTGGHPFFGVRVMVDVPEKEFTTGPKLEGLALTKTKGGGGAFLNPAA